MKKLLLILIAFTSSAKLMAQAMAIFEAPQNNITTTQLRAPNGLSSSAYMRACALVLQTELGYIPNGTTLTTFGFTMSTGSSVSAATSGNFTLYLQNTTDVTYNKGTNWATIPTGMTSCFANVMTIPLSASSTSILITLSTPYVYTGGGLYVAYDWYSAGPYSTTPATYWAENSVFTAGCASSVSATGAPGTLTTTNFRPAFLFGFNNPYSNEVTVYAIEAPGRIAGTIGTPHTVSAWVKNQSTVPLTNISVTAAATGANTYNNVQVISSLAAGASTYVTFGPFNPTLPGTQTITVFTGNDQYNPNNPKSYLQEVTCDIAGTGPAVSGYSFNSVGFNTGAGIISTPYNNVNTNTLVGMRGAVSTNTASVGNTVYGVLLNAAGSILATSNNVVITSAMLGTFINFTFPTPTVLSPATTYYLGFAQTANTTLGYFPAGTYGSNYLQPNLYYTCALTGGALTVLTNNFGFFGIEAVLAHTVTVTAVSPTVSCGSNATITALSSTNYSWSTGATTSSIAVNTATATTLFTVTATNTLGCTASKIVTLNITPIPVSIAATPTAVCAGSTVSLTASGATNYTWTTTSSTLNTTVITDAPNVSTAYTLAGANANGCFASTVLQLQVNPLPVVNLSSTNGSVCLGNTVSLIGSGTAASYSWSTGATTSSINFSPIATSVYTLFGTSALGCVKTATTNVTVDSFTPAINVLPSTTICAGQSVTLTATGASTLQWNTGSIFASINATPVATSNFSVIGKGLNGCIGSASTTVNVNPTPTVLASSTRTSICRGESSVFTASGAVSYVWSTGATTASVSLNPTTTILQNYTVTGTNAFGCSSDFVVNLKANTCAGILELSGSNAMQVYPNPNNGLFTVVLDDTWQASELHVCSIGGQLLQAEKLSGTTANCSLQDFPAGIYLLKVTDATGANHYFKISKY